MDNKNRREMFFNMSDMMAKGCGIFSQEYMMKMVNDEPTRAFRSHIKQCMSCDLSYRTIQFREEIRDYHAMRVEEAKRRGHKCISVDEMIDMVFSEQKEVDNRKMLECNECIANFMKYSDWKKNYHRNYDITAKVLKMIFRQPIIDLLVEPCVLEKEVELMEAGELADQVIERIDEHLCNCGKCADKYVDRWLACQNK